MKSLTEDRSEKGGLSESDKAYIREYRRSLPPKDSEDLLERWLHRVITIAKRYAVPTLPIADIIAEGNLALTEAVLDGIEEEAALENAVAAQIEDFLERMRLEKESDDILAMHVTALSETIDRFRTTYGEKPTIDELANEMGVPQEMIINILKLTGEDPEREK